MKYTVKGYVNTAQLSIGDDNADIHVGAWLDKKQLERLRDDITVALRVMDEAQGIITKDFEDWADKEASHVK